MTEQERVLADAKAWIDRWGIDNSTWSRLAAAVLAMAPVVKAAERWDDANENYPEKTAMADMHDAEKSLHVALAAWRNPDGPSLAST